jgi:hypothetical protein
MSTMETIHQECAEAGERINGIGLNFYCSVSGNPENPDYGVLIVDEAEAQPIADRIRHRIANDIFVMSALSQYGVATALDSTAAFREYVESVANKHYVSHPEAVYSDQLDKAVIASLKAYLTRE